MKKTLLVLSALAIGFSAAAKLPAPSEEAKAKAAEAAAKAAHGNKVAGYKLCLSQDKAAAHYFKNEGKGKGKDDKNKGGKGQKGGIKASSKKAYPTTW